jgi:hypothetical protein
MAWLTDTSIVVAEVTVPSHGVEKSPGSNGFASWYFLYRCGTGRRLSALLVANPRLGREAYNSGMELGPTLGRFLFLLF